MKRILITLLLCVCAVQVLFAQTDTIFWFAAPDLEASHQQTPIQFCFTTYDEAATITVEQPTNSAFPTATFTVAANSFHTFDVSNWVNIIETQPANTVLNKGFRIRSSSFISCYYESVGNNSEMYMLKGTSGMGTDFLVPMQTTFSNNYSSTPSSIEILATENNTVVQITAPVALQGGNPAGNTITITLQRGQSYAIHANSTSASAHLYNTIIHSNKPIVVNSTDDSVNSNQGCFDLIGEQLVPVNMIGRRYVAVRNFSSYSNDFERVYVFPLHDNTSVSFNGVSQTVSTGGHINRLLTDTATLITSDKPVAVFQITATGCEQGGTMLPQIECTGSNKVTHLRPNISSIIITIVTENQHVGAFTLNGSTNIVTATDFHPLAGDPTLSYCLKDISSYVSQGSVMTLSNSSGRFQLGILDGDGSGSCSYGFFSDYARASYVRFDMDNAYCTGDSIAFGYFAPNVDNLTLTCPNGQQLTTPPFLLTDVTPDVSGWYHLSGTDTSSCFQVLGDSIRLVVGSPSETDTITVRAQDYYVWFGDTLRQSGQYLHTLTNAEGCDSSFVLQLTLNSLTYDTLLLCENQLPYHYTNGAIDTTFGLDTPPFSTFNINLSTQDDYDSILHLTLIVHPAPVAAIAGSPHICEDTPTELTASGGTSYLWSTNATTSTISVNATGSYSVTVTNENGCTADTSIAVSASHNPILSVTNPNICIGNSYNLSVGYLDTSTIVLGAGETTLSLTDTIFLPDGISCDPYGCSYRSPLTFSAYGDNDRVQSVEDIYYVRLNMEHSYVGDIYINITCPNGQKANILKFSGSGTSSCTGAISSDCIGWQNGNNAPEYSYFGQAYDTENSSYPCNPDAYGNQPGTGWNYCWSNNTTQGYSYSSGAGSLVYRSSNTNGYSLDSSNLAAGTNFFHPDQSFSSLIGCPLNGSWYIEVIDGWNIDNGYIFGWELALRAETVSDEDAVFTHATAEGPYLTTLSDSLFSITPPANIDHDTTIYYTITIHDDFGCGYDTTLAISYHAPQHTQSTLTLVENQLPYHYTSGQLDTTFLAGSPELATYHFTFSTPQGCDSIVDLTVIVYYNTADTLDTTICAGQMPYVWHGHTFTQEDSYTVTQTNANGSDHVVTYNLDVDTVVVAISEVTHITCEGDSTGMATGIAQGGTAPFSYLWRDAAGNAIGTAPQISNLPAGNYSFTVTDALGCQALQTVNLHTLNIAPEAGTIADNQAPCSGSSLEPFTGESAQGGDNGQYLWQISTDGTSWDNAPGSANAQDYTYPDAATQPFMLRRAWVTQSCGTVYSNTVTVTLNYPGASDIALNLCESDLPYHYINGQIDTVFEPGTPHLTTLEYQLSTLQGCDSSVTLTVSVNPNSETDIQDQICMGDGYYRNGFAIPGSETFGLTELNRSVTLQSSGGCDSVLNLHLDIIDNSLEIVNMTYDFCEEMSAILVAVSPLTDYVWSTGDQTDQIMATHAGTYTVTASMGQCSNTAQFNIPECEFPLRLPNAISPSKKDGTNDCFSIPERLQNFIDKFEITIINRWGEVVFHSTDKNFRWYGDYKGRIYKDNVYNYVIYYFDTSGKRYHLTGAVTVL